MPKLPIDNVLNMLSQTLLDALFKIKKSKDCSFSNGQDDVGKRPLLSSLI